ncbi:hypothetical protein [Streptomyces sp. NPDC046197]|uniref:hypothetical protein n=1 Tax=Streptomyces sp. NPDC046197 TaxID=3154337 RepID=UPI0033C2F0EA
MSASVNDGANLPSNSIVSFTQRQAMAGPGCPHAEGRDRAETRARTFVRLCGAAFPQGRPDDHGRRKKLPVPNPPEYGIEL